MNHAQPFRLPAGNPPGVQRPAPAGRLLSGDAEARAFWRVRYRLIRTRLRQTFCHTWFRLSLILTLSLVLWLGLFWLFLDGFHFLRTTIAAPDVHDQMVRAVFGMFFASLMVMLVFSSGIILYASLLHSREAAFLLTMPARTERVFLHKFQEAILLSSWGFVLLASPMLLAYGIEAAAPWYYFAMLVPLLVAFVYIPGALGAIVCLWVVHRLPNRRFLVAAAAGVLAALGGAWIFWSLLGSPESNLLTPVWFQEMLARLRFTEQRLLPSWWLSSGLLEAARNQWSESTLFLALLISNALFFRQLAIWAAGRIYRPAYSALYGGQRSRKRATTWWLDRAVLQAARFLPLQMRLLMLKDLRVFRRDPVQWSQLLIFFGLLALYFMNIRRFSYDVHYAGWVNMVSFLNLSVVGLLLSTFNTRFIFPMISLEGRHFWVLGLLPLRRETILWEKFFFAAGGSVIPSSLLILLSDLSLRVSPLILASHQFTCLILSVGLSGIAVGLGAKLPNLREQSPSRIAAGFGGTLNLVVGTLYILLVVLLTALPCHFYQAFETGYARAMQPSTALRSYFYVWLLAGTLGSVLLALLATLIPLRIGFRALRRLEF